MLKLKHVLRPLRTVRIAKSRLSAYLHVRRCAADYRRRFGDDPRYDLQSVTEGFAPRPSRSANDALLLERICEAYAKAIQHQQSASALYGPSGWWREVQQTSLGPVMRALGRRDMAALGRMYGNFFRDACATGLVPMPFSMSKPYFHGQIREIYRQAYMGDVLHRVDYWATQIGEPLPLSVLAGPEVGNPFGGVVDGTLVRADAEYQHYCARKVLSFLGGTDRPTVVEIGGGYGGMGYYLLRDCPGGTYFDFDTPESLALTSYYLLKAFPSAKCVLYGEQDFVGARLCGSEIVLMPLFEMPKLSANSADVTFSSNAMSDLSRSAMEEYLRLISRNTKSVLIYIGNRPTAELISELVREHYPSWSLIETRDGAWHRHRTQRAGEVELVFRVHAGPDSARSPA